MFASKEVKGELSSGAKKLYEGVAGRKKPKASSLLGGNSRETSATLAHQRMLILQ
jgi:hypothetical protein